MMATTIKTLTEEIKSMDIEELMNLMIKVNREVSSRANVIMDTLGEDHPTFDVAVQVFKDAANAHDEMVRTSMYYYDGMI